MTDSRERIVDTYAWVEQRPYVEFHAGRKVTTILLPDIAFVRRERLFGLSETFLQVPAFAPDVAIEIRSPSDRPGIRDWKRAQYLEAGSDLVLVVDPERRTIRAFASGINERMFAQGDTFEHPAAPWLRFEVAEAFSDLEP